MLKSIEKESNNIYNYVIQNVNNFGICEPGNPYGHVREFMRLKKEMKYEAHRVISPIATILAIKEKDYGVVTDINGNTYYFDVFEDGYYRVAKVAKYNHLTKEVTNEKYIKTNS